MLGGKHDQEGHRIAGVGGLKGEAWLCKEKIEGCDTDKRTSCAVQVPVGGDCSQQHAENVDGNDIGLAEARAW